MRTLHRAARLCSAGILVGLGCSVMPRVIVARQIPRPGTRVRVLDVVGRQPVATGTLVRLVGDTVILAASRGSERTVALCADYRWEVSEGLHRQTLQGAGVGFVFGALAGALVGVINPQVSGLGQPTCGSCVESRGERMRTVLVAAALFGAAGTAIGVLAGASTERERWRPVDRGAPRLGIVPTGSRGAALVMSLEF